MISQQLIVQCDVFKCVIYISNNSQYLKNEERYGKTIHGVIISRVLSNRTKLNSFHVHFKQMKRKTAVPGTSAFTLA